MAKVSPLQSNFNGGEFSPLLYGRVDTERYATGLAICKNYIPTIQGGLTRRPGTYFVAATKTAAKAARLVRFEFSTTQAYVLEFGDQYLRFYKDHAQILGTAELVSNGTFDAGVTGWTDTSTSGSISWDSGTRSMAVSATTGGPGSGQQAVAIANPGAVHTFRFSIAFGFSPHTGTNVRIGTAAGLGDVYSWTGVPAGDYSLNVVMPAATVYITFEVTGGLLLRTTYVDGVSLQDATASIYEVVTPYLEADLRGLRFTQSADVLYIVHPSYAPRKLSRTGHTAWTLSTITFSDGPYFGTNATTTTLTPSAATGVGVTLTASAVTGINGGAGFQATDVGRIIRIREGTTWGWVTITAYTSTTVVTVTVNSTLTNTNPKTVWRLGLWSGTTGYPSQVVFHEDRLVFAGATDSPQRIDGSYSSDYENFAPTELDGTVTDAHAVGFTLNSNTVNAIHWMAADEKGLLIGTAGGEWIVRPSLQSEALSPTNIAAKQATTYGSANIAAVSAGKAAIFVQRAGRKVRELRYFLQEDGFESPDLTLLAEHITAGGIVEMARQAEPQSLIWCVRADGTLACVTYERDLDSLRVGWHRHTLGGVGDATGGPPIVESAAVIPAPDGTKDELWVIVRRWINGASVRYVEYLTPLFEDTMAQSAAYFVDSGLSYSGTAATTFSGLDHLEGETLTVLADGAVHPDVTVASGSVTLDYAASVVHIGYAYNSDGQLLRLEAGARDGTALGKTRRTHRVGILLHRTLGLSIGMDFDNLDEITFRTDADVDGEPPALFSGILSETMDAGYDFENQFCWRQSQPLPGTILAIMPQMVTQDRG